MTKMFCYSFMFILMLVILSGCQENQMQIDAREIAQLGCELRMMAEEMEEGDFEMLADFTAKMAELSQKVHAAELRYNKDEDFPEFERLINEELGKTPCSGVELDELLNFFQ